MLGLHSSGVYSQLLLCTIVHPMIRNLKRNKCGGQSNPSVRANLRIISASITRLTQNTLPSPPSLTHKYTASNWQHVCTVCFLSPSIHSCDSLSKGWLLGSVAIATTDHMMVTHPVSIFISFLFFFQPPPPPLEYLLAFCTTAVNDLLKYSITSLHFTK